MEPCAAAAHLVGQLVKGDDVLQHGHRLVEGACTATELKVNGCVRQLPQWAVTGPHDK